MWNVQHFADFMESKGWYLLRIELLLHHTLVITSILSTLLDLFEMKNMKSRGLSLQLQIIHLSHYLSIPLITGRGTGIETCGIGSVFPPDDLWIGLDTYMNCILIYDLLLKVWMIMCATCYICIDWWGKGWPMVDRPSGHWLSCTASYLKLVSHFIKTVTT